MKFIKKNILFISIIVICLAIVAGSSVAYFTDEDRAHNVITTGAVAVCIEEWTLHEGELYPYPDTAVEVMPGMNVSKIVTVKNEDEDALVRVSYEIVVMDGNGDEMVLTEEEILEYISIIPDMENWEVKAEFDGWYYYKSVLENGEVTFPLFENVEFAKNMGNKFEDATFKVNVHAQAVQAQNNAYSAIDAVGWPEE